MNDAGHITDNSNKSLPSIHIIPFKNIFLSKDMAARRSVYLLLGSNLHRPLRQMAIALQLIESKLSKISRRSAIFRTEPWGDKNQPFFYNQVVRLQSTRLPHEILRILKSIEQEMGRLHIRHWGPRNIDIDILFYGQFNINSSDLTIPHPKIIDRRFVLVPLVDLAPHFIHPTLGKTMRSLLDICKDTSMVTRT